MLEGYFTSHRRGEAEIHQRGDTLALWSACLHFLLPESEKERKTKDLKIPKRSIKQQPPLPLPITVLQPAMLRRQRQTM